MREEAPAYASWSTSLAFGCVASGLWARAIFVIARGRLRLPKIGVGREVLDLCHAPVACGELAASVPRRATGPRKACPNTRPRVRRFFFFFARPVAPGSH